jgi:hypothetical protein
MTEFNAPLAGRGAGQGTVPQDNNTEGAITGYYVTGHNVYHGFLRTPDGTITSFDPPGSGTGSEQGTVPQSINEKGAIAGYYQDENNLYYGFLCVPDGTCTTIDAPGAGTEANLGTFGEDINSAGTIAGFYSDANNVYHGFVRIPDGAPRSMTLTRAQPPARARLSHSKKVSTGTERLSDGTLTAAVCTTVICALLTAALLQRSTAKARFPPSLGASTRRGRSRGTSWMQAAWVTACCSLTAT